MFALSFHFDSSSQDHAYDHEETDAGDDGAHSVQHT
jgi:hypothetical protein